MYNAFGNRYAQRVRAGHMVDFKNAQYEYERKLISIGAVNQDDPAEIILARLLDGEIIDALLALPEEYRSTLFRLILRSVPTKKRLRLSTVRSARSALGCPARDDYPSKYPETTPRRKDY